MTYRLFFLLSSKIIPIQVGYPDELAYKLYDRRAKILVLFKQMEDAEEAYKSAVKYLDKVRC